MLIEGQTFKSEPTNPVQRRIHTNRNSSSLATSEVSFLLYYKLHGFLLIPPTLKDYSEGQLADLPCRALVILHRLGGVAGILTEDSHGFT